MTPTLREGLASNGQPASGEPVNATTSPCRHDPHAVSGGLMLFEAGKGAGAPAESDDATPFWHVLSPEVAIARIAAGHAAVAASPDGFSRPHSLSALAALA